MSEAIKNALREVWPDLPGLNLASCEIHLALARAGFAVVPREPSAEMNIAGLNAETDITNERIKSPFSDHRAWVPEVYKAMLNAALESPNE